MIGEQDLKEICNNIPCKKVEDKTFLITGANGFLGSNIVHVLMYLNEKCLSRKCRVIALCRNKYKADKVFQKYLEDSSFNIYIHNAEEKLMITQNIDYIIHAASIAVTSEFSLKPVDVLVTNMVGTYSLLEFAKLKNVQSFLYFSSGAVYGEISKNINVLRETDSFALAFTETCNCYAEGKRAGEALCRAYWEQYRVPAKMVRISHTYGPGINLSDGRVFSDFVNSICQRTPLVIKGSGNDVRPFCYITDAIRGFFTILFDGENGEAYNLANDEQTVTIRELAELLVYEAFPERCLKIESKYSINQDVKKTMVCTEKLRKLGWSPEIDIVEGFKRTVESYEKDEYSSPDC